MGQSRVQGLGVIGGWTVLLLTHLGMTIQPALAQSPCEPPKPNEYLLLVVSSTSDDQQLVQQTLPQDIESEVCQYVDDVVTRVGGFENRLIAEDWAAYVTDAIGLQAYVVRPNGAAALEEDPETSSTPATSPRGDTRSAVAFNPEALGPGYAVLVDYFNEPELAAQVRQAIEGDVGLVSYGQRPYLLIEYTQDGESATSTLNTLSRQGFLSMVVDSRRVTVIRSRLD